MALYVTKHPSSVRYCAFLIFTCLSITVGVLVVCLTSQKTLNKPCQFSFKQSVQSAISYDSRPRHVAVGDFNNDSHLDITVANSGTDSIGIFFSYGNGSFESQITFSTGLGSRPYSVAVGNFNNDIRPDIVVANYGTNNIGIFLGDGNGHFTNQIITSLGSSRPLALTVGYFNNDHYLDVAVANYGTLTIGILLGFNNGSFRIDAIYYMGYDSIPYSLITADFNKDNRSDIAVVNYGTNNLVILIANTNGSFISQEYSTGLNSHPSSIAIGDFNNDSHLDIALTNSGTGNVGIFLQNGNVTFTNMLIYSTGSNSRPQAIVTGHLDDDNTLDIIVVDSQNNNVLVLKGMGNASFLLLTSHSTGYNSNPFSIAIGNFDNDNKSDIVITNNATNNIIILLAYNVYLTANQTTYPTGTNSEPSSVAVGDFNNDHFLDVVVANTKSDNVGVFINLGNGTFGDQIRYFLGNGSRPNPIAVGDVNNDKQLDIIVLSKLFIAIGILLGYGNGSFSEGHLYSTGSNSNPVSFTVGDLNNDNNVDIAIANYNAGNIGVLFGCGNGTFRDVILFSTGDNFYPALVVVNDLNNDKILDIVACDDVHGGIAILTGYGNDSFSIPLVLSTDADLLTSVAVGDLNNDHRLDIVYVGYSTSTVGILLGYGNQTFSNITKYSTGQSAAPLSVILVNFNNDTILDIVVVNTNGYNIGIFLGFGNGYFAPQMTYSTELGSAPVSIASGDFNNDNRMDIVVSNAGAANIGVFLMHDKFDFAFETSYSTGSGSHPYSVAIGDFNKDNQSDIVVANSGNDNIELLLDYNEGAFVNIETHSTGLGSYPQFVSVADFNRDNQLDLVVANNKIGSINVFLAHNNGTFDEPFIYLIGSDSFPSSIAVGDFNNDNWTDIGVANNGTNTIAVFLGFDYATFTNDTFSTQVPYSVPSYVAVGDFNNDHQWDIVVADYAASSIHIYLGYGNGTFAEKLSFSTGTYPPYTIAVGDLNNDNQLDVVVTISDGNNIGIFLGYGNGSFQSQTTYSTGNPSNPLSVAVGDFNKDRILDIVVTNYASNNIGIFMGHGDGTFAQQTLYAMPDQSSPRSVAVDDLNNDNILDIAVANYGLSSIGIYFGYGNGSFKDMIIVFTDDIYNPWAIATGDINNDTWKDIAVASQLDKKVGIFLGGGNGTFLSPVMYPTGSQSGLSSITIADLNNDTKLDIVVSDLGNDNGNIGVFYGHGDGHFAVLKTYSTGFKSNPTSFAICDFNNDNRPDLAINYLNKGSIGIMLRLKSEPFATPTLYAIGSESYPTSVATGDFNNDNQLDIVVANSGANNIGILLGNGNGIFFDQQTYSTGDNSKPVSVAVSDINNDNYLDIIVANAKINTISIFRGYGNGSVAFLASYSTGISSTPSSITVKDLNKDNHMDMVVTNFGSDDVLVFLGTKNGTFLEPLTYSLGYDARPQSVAIGDINNDGLFDIIVANYGTDYVQILLQTC